MKESKTALLSVRVQASVKERIEKIAAENDVSMSEIVSDCLNTMVGYSEFELRGWIDTVSKAKELLQEQMDEYSKLREMYVNLKAMNVTYKVAGKDLQQKLFVGADETPSCVATVPEAVAPGVFNMAKRGT